MFIQIEINSCKDCPFFDESRVYTADSFDMAFEWKCKKSNKVIRSYVDWNDTGKVDIPDWCPCKMKSC